jgi:hypothetical protein
MRAKLKQQVFEMVNIADCALPPIVGGTPVLF